MVTSTAFQLTSGQRVKTLANGGGPPPPPPPPPPAIELSGPSVPNGSWFLAEGAESGTATGFHTRFDDFADDDVMVAPLDDVDHFALDMRRNAFENRRAVRTLAIGLAVYLAAFLGGRLEEREGGRLLARAEHVEREGPRLLDDLVGARIGLDADRDEGRVERGLRHPVDRRRRHVAVRRLRRQHVEPVRDHAQRSFLGFGVHALTVSAHFVEE